MLLPLSHTPSGQHLPREVSFKVTKVSVLGCRGPQHVADLCREREKFESVLGHLPRIPQLITHHSDSIGLLQELKHKLTSTSVCVFSSALLPLTVLTSNPSFV